MFIFPFFRSIIIICKAKFQIVDYTAAHVIIIDDGQSKIQDGIFRIIHPIDIKKYDAFVTETKIFVERHIPKTNPFYPILNEEIKQAVDLIQNIVPQYNNNDNDKNYNENNDIDKGKNNYKRNKRSFNIIGTAWKYIAGTPDHDDFEMLEFNINELNQNNNKQVVINQMLSDRMNNVTKIVNEISNAIVKNSHLNNEIALTLQNRIRLIKEQLINIHYAIQWAKSGVINSIILDKLEIKLALEKLSKEKMPFASNEEAMEYATVNVLHKNSIILYVIKIPTTNEEVYQNLLLYPVKKNEKVIKLSFRNIIKNSKEIYGLKSNCSKYDPVKICNNNQLIDLRNNTCITNIIKSLSSYCTYTNSQHIPLIENILPGVILLNDYNDTILIDEVTHHLSGTFLIKFSNSTIMAQNKIFRNLEAPQIKTVPAVLQPTPSEKILENILTIESLRELHLNNTHTIRTLRVGTIINGVSTMVYLLILVVIGTLILHLYRISQRTSIMHLNTQNSYSPPGPGAILTNIQPTNNTLPSTFRINNIPYF